MKKYYELESATRNTMASLTSTRTLREKYREKSVIVVDSNSEIYNKYLKNNKIKNIEN